MRVISFIYFLLLSLQVFSQGDSALERTISELLQSQPGRYALAYKNLSHPESLYINADEEFHAASTMKTPVMIEVFKQAAAGSFSLEDSLLVKNEFRSISDSSTFSLELSRDDGEHLYEQIGRKRTIRELVRDMIIYSSNLATNIILELVGAEKVNQSMHELGAKKIRVLRGVEDMKAFQKGMNNTTTAFDLMVIFEKLARGQAVNPEADKEMLEILGRQTHRDLIPALLPEELKIANKTGWISGVHHDSALITLPDGHQYVLVILSREMKDMETGTRMLSRVSRTLYNHIINQKFKTQSNEK